MTAGVTQGTGMGNFTSRSPVCIHLQLSGTRSYYHRRGIQWNEPVVSMQPGRASCPDPTHQPHLLPCNNTYCSPGLQPWPSNNHPNGPKLWGPPGIHCCLLFHTITGMLTPVRKRQRPSHVLFAPRFSFLSKICKKCCLHFSVVFLISPSLSIEKWLAMPQKSWALKSIFHFLFFSSL